MPDSVCQRCGVDQRYPSTLKRHLARKTPCAPIVEKESLSESDRAKKHNCRYCGRAFASNISMYRHIRRSCKIANSDEGMEKLMDHTLQKQLATQNAIQNAKIDEQSKQIAEMAAMMKQMIAGQLIPTQQQLPTTGPITVNNGPVTQQQVNNTGPVTTQHINTQINIIQPWDGEKRISVTAEMIAEAFTENPRLIEYCKMNDTEKTNPEGAGPYVLEALLALTRRAHKDPASRNIYLSPKRADQVMVCLIDGSWEVRSLEEATRMMFEGVAKEIKQVVRTTSEREKLSLQVQGSASYIPMMYEDEPDRYVALAKKPVSAHLTNTAPALKNKK